MTRSLRIALVGGMALGIGAASPPWAIAQEAADACGLLTKEEFASLVGRQAYTEPEAMPYAGGSLCGYDHGQVILLAGADALARLETVFARFGQANVAHRPVPDLGADAYSFLVQPENRYQDAAAFVVFTTGQHAIAASVNAAEGETAETALPQAQTVAEALAAALR